MPTVKTKPKTRKRYSWRDEYYLQAAEHARAGMTPAKIGQALGVPADVFKRWVKQRPVLAQAIESGRTKDKSVAVPAHAGETFVEYIYQQLPPDLRSIWKQIEFLDEKAAEGECDDYADRVNQLFYRPGAHRARQSLWIHAFVGSNFNANEACRKINISRQAVEKWRVDEPEFDQLFKYIINDCKKDFGEACLLRQMGLGDAACIIYFAKTQLADRGYAQPTKQVAHSGQMSVVATTVDVAAVLDKLPMEQRRLMLDAVREAQQPTKVVESLPEIPNEGK